MKPIIPILKFWVVVCLFGACTSTQNGTPYLVKETPTNTINPPTSTHTPALTLAPTLNPEEAQKVIQERFTTISDCAAPCFWGIIPNQTTLAEAQNIFANLGLRITNDNVVYYSLDDKSSGIISLDVNKELVRSLSVSLSMETPQADTARKWSAYSPEALFTQYGHPSRIEFLGSFVADNVVFSESPKWYSMYIHFEKFNLIVRYEDGELNTKEFWFEACPLINQFRYIKLWFGENPKYPPPSAFPLEEVSDLDIEKFTTLMKEEPAYACFNLNEKIFR